MDDGLGVIDIPVYIYVIYNLDVQNISDAQINSQISVLNNDFNDTNFNDIPDEFAASGATVNINFTLDQGDVNRIYDSTSSWGTGEPLSPYGHSSQNTQSLYHADETTGGS